MVYEVGGFKRIIINIKDWGRGNVNQQQENNDGHKWWDLNFYIIFFSFHAISKSTTDTTEKSKFAQYLSWNIFHFISREGGCRLQEEVVELARHCLYHRRAQWSLIVMGPYHCRTQWWPMAIYFHHGHCLHNISCLITSRWNLGVSYTQVIQCKPANVFFRSNPGVCHHQEAVDDAAGVERQHLHPRGEPRGCLFSKSQFTSSLKENFQFPSHHSFWRTSPRKVLTQISTWRETSSGNNCHIQSIVSM